MAKKKNGSSDVKIKRAVRTLHERADQATRLVEQRDQKEAESKTASSHFKSQIKQLDADLRKLSTEVRDRATFREVECEIRFEYRTARVATVRSDTGEVISERPMLESERQRELPLDQPKIETKPSAPPKRRRARSAVKAESAP